MKQKWKRLKKKTRGAKNPDECMLKLFKQVRDKAAH